MGGGGSAPKAYTPAYQGQADSSYMGTLNSLTASDQNNKTAIDTGYTGAYGTIANNPYDPAMVQGTVNAANVANQVGQNDLNMGGVVTGAANQGFADANTVRGYAPQFQNLASIAQGYAGPLAADATTLRSYAPELMELGLDPNFSEYNYGMTQAKDAANINNAESGIAGSPFASGVTSDAMAAYKRNYDAARFSKAMQAISALSGLSGAAGGLDMQALQALQGAGGFLTSGAGMYDQAGKMSTGAGNLAAMGSDLSHAGADTIATAAMMPYEAVNTIGQDKLAALGDMSRGEATASGSVKGDVSGYGDYLNIGQNATNLNQQAAKINYQDSFMGGLGQLLGVMGQIGVQYAMAGG